MKYKLNSAPISPYLFGQNAWMPNFIDNGEIDKLWEKLRAARIRLVRIGGICFDENISYEQLIYLIDRIKDIGAEPLVQIPLKSTPLDATNIIEHINGKMDKKVRFWSIGNEPDWHWKIEDPDKVSSYFKPIASRLKEYDPSILIFGPDCGRLNMGLMSPLIGGGADITGLDENGNFYIDVVNYHTYNKSDAGAVESDINILLDLISRANKKRPAESLLRWAITEFNITTDNNKEAGRNKVWSFYTGQYFAEVYDIAMKHKAFTIAPWSIHESKGARTGPDLGMFDSGPAYYPRPVYYHTQLLSLCSKANYLPGYTNKEQVKLSASADSTGFSVMLMNEDEKSSYNFTLSFDDQKMLKPNPLEVHLNAGLANEYTGTIEAEETQVLVFASSGRLTKKIIYNKNHAMNHIVPTVRDY